MSKPQLNFNWEMLRDGDLNFGSAFFPIDPEFFIQKEIYQIDNGYGTSLKGENGFKRASGFDSDRGYVG